jgi:CubicO group peptidase (beta-lactamase class C family)
MSVTRLWCRRMAAVLLSAAGAAYGAGVEPGSDAAQLERLLAALNTGDQAAYERFIDQNWSPAALEEFAAEDHASSLARIYTDTRGIELERIVRSSPEWLQARGRARLTGIEYCLTIKRDRGGIADVLVSDLHPAGSDLKTPEPDEVVRTTQALVEAYDRVGEMSGVVLIAKDDQVIFRRAYGKASLAYDAPMTLETRLNTASIGKSFTGVAIAQLIDAGKLSLDSTVGKVLPNYPDEVVRNRVTIRQLLTHTSGLGDLYDHPQWPILRFRIRTVADYMKLVVGRPLLSEPGERYEYSNAGYILLGAIVEKLSGQDFYDYVRDHIFKPSGMTRSSYPMADEEVPGLATPLTNFMDKGETAYLYRLAPPRNAAFQLAARGGPQGGASVTGDDLLAFDIAFRAGKLTSPAMVKQMSSAQGPAVGGRRGAQPETSPGLGFEITRRNGHSMIGHQGGDLGIASCVYHFPETGYTLVVLTNRDPRAGRVLLQMFRSLVTRSTLGDATPPPQDCVQPS